MVENFNECQAWRKKYFGRRPYTDWIKQERYREWLVGLIKSDYVILITARSIKYKDVTLAQIEEKLKWLPKENYWNQYNQGPPIVKRTIVKELIFPELGTPDK